MEQNIENRLKELEKQVLALRQTNTIPLEVDRSFTGRGFLRGVSITEIDSTEYVSLSQEISLTGNPQVITVPQYPFRWIKLIGAENYYVPIYVLAEFP